MGAFAQLTAGELFARDFRILRPLAEGGMGAVYRVEQVSTGRERALKIMHPHFALDAETRERFTQEARIGARLQSEHVVEVVSAGVDEPSGMPWMVMELLEGAELNKVVESRGRLSPTEALEVFRQLTHGLGEAHRIGLVHRDIKPDNLFLASSNRSGGSVVLKILDFGVAKLVQERSGSDSGTRAVGTPKWMAPEQSETGGAIGPPTDVWPLGLLAFYLLTGRIYWRTASNAATNLTVLMREMLFEPIVDPGQRAEELMAAGSLPPTFSAWFNRCVVREVGARFRDANEAFAALEPVLLSAGAQPGPAALAGISGDLRSLVAATPRGPPTGPAPTPAPGNALGSGDGATLYPSRPPVPAKPGAPLSPTAAPVPVALPVTLSPPPASAVVAPPPVPAAGEHPSRSGGMGIALGAAALVVGVVAVGLQMRTPATPEPALTPPVAVTPPFVPAPPPPAPVAAAPRSFTLTIQSEPAGADVMEGATRLGATPIELTIEAASVATSPRTLVIQHPGYLPFTLSQGASSEAVHRDVALVPEPRVEAPTPHSPEASGGHGHHPKSTPSASPETGTTASQPQIRMTR